MNARIAPKLRNSARGQDCTFMLDVCRCDPDYVVLCHAPSQAKGTGNKSPDHWSAYGCDRCHYQMDHHLVDDEAQVWLWAIFRTQNIMIGKGLIVVPFKQRRPR